MGFLKFLLNVILDYLAQALTVLGLFLLIGSLYAGLALPAITGVILMAVGFVMMRDWTR